MTTKSGYRAAALLMTLPLLAPAALARDTKGDGTLTLDGRYRITSRTVMPHLEEMRRITAVETRCLQHPRADALFPVLRQRALLGCTLVPQAGAAAGRYALRCKSDRVATGEAAVEIGEAAIEGDLQVKMGAKNMTFAQFVTLERRGACGVAAR